MSASEIMAVAGQVAAVYIEFVSIKPWGKNPRRIPESAVTKIAIQMCRSGFGAPLLARSEDRRLVAGHTRSRSYTRLLEMVAKHGLPPEVWVEEIPAEEPEGKVSYHSHHKTTPAWADLPLDKYPPDWFQWMKPDIRSCLETGTIPCRLMDLTNQEADELALADNRTGEEAEWNQDMLGEQFQSMPVETHLFTGFDANELEPLLAYTPPEPPQAPAGSGDIPAEPSATPGASMNLRLDKGQRVAFESAHAAARELWERPDLPAAEFAAELCRQFLQRNPGPPPTIEPPPLITPSAGASDF